MRTGIVYKRFRVGDSVTLNHTFSKIVVSVHDIERGWYGLRLKIGSQVYEGKESIQIKSSYPRKCTAKEEGDRDTESVHSDVVVSYVTH